MLCAAEPAIFMPVPGGWGRRGATHIHLAAANEATLRSAFTMAWRRLAPSTLLAAVGTVLGSGERKGRNRRGGA
jgi:hypothetical protein